MIRVVLALLLIIPLSGCLSDSNAESTLPRVSFTEIASGDSTVNGIPENRKIEVFTDQNSLNTALAIYVQFVVEHTVDFNNKRVVLLSMGERSSGGYSIGAQYIEDNGDYLELNILLSKPGDSCGVAQVLTYPFQFVEVQSTKELIIREHITVTNCDE